jgi:hypothetical protein
MTWEHVLSVEEFHDGPKSGFAMSDGRLCAYVASWSVADDAHAPVFQVTPVDPGLKPLIEEAWLLWTRWRSAYDRGEVALDTLPALPADKERSAALRDILGPVLAAQTEETKLKTAQFRDAPEESAGYVVNWSELSGD